MTRLRALLGEGVSRVASQHTEALVAGDAPDRAAPPAGQKLEAAGADFLQIMQQMLSQHGGGDDPQ